MERIIILILVFFFLIMDVVPRPFSLGILASIKIRSTSVSSHKSSTSLPFEDRYFCSHPKVVRGDDYGGDESGLLQHLKVEKRK